MGTPGEDSRLLRYLEGGLTPAERQQVERQLDGSPTDRLVIAELARVYGMGWDADRAGRTVTIDEDHGGEPEETFRVPERYALREHLGEGGMGVVFGAHDRHLDRPVAIKRLRNVARTVEGKARLRREAQALAQLSHPNIVQIYDVGDHEGRLYLAMEWVVGLTLEQWCKAAPRTLGELMAMYVQAGEGLAAAHAHGIVHRDFKPSNALVGADGRVRVVDFGLARQWVSRDHDPITASQREETRSERPGRDGLVAVTEAGLVVGTPAYMAPEQAYGREPEPACDQFSFCVALCEALYGQRPAVTASEPTPAREWLAALAERSTTGILVPTRIRAALERGLDVEPQRRWPSMRALLDELQGSTRGRRRRTWGVLAVGGLGVGSAVLGLRLVGPPAGVVDGCEGGAATLSEAWGDEQRAALRARAAEPEATEALATRLDAHAAAWRQAHHAICTAATAGPQSPEQADLRLSCLEQQRRDLRAAVQVLLEGPPELLRSGVAAVAGLPQAQACVEQTTPDPMIPAEPTMLEGAGRLRDALERADVLRLGGQREAALGLARRLVADAKALGHAPLVAAAELRLGQALSGVGRYADARGPLEHAFFGARSEGAHELAMQAARALVPVVRRLEPTLEQAQRWTDLLCVAAQTTGDVDGQAQCEVNRGHLSLRRGETEAGLERVQQALAELPADHRTLAHSELLMLRAEALVDLGRFHEATAAYEETVAAERERVGPHAVSTLKVRGQLANLYSRQGEHERARQELVATLAALERVLGPEHPDVGRSVAHLALTLEDLGQIDEAIAHHERALAIFERGLGPRSSDVAKVLANLGQIYMRRGDSARALVWLERGLEVMSEHYDEGHPALAQYHEVLGNALAMEDRPVDAASHLERALRDLETALGPDHLRVAEACAALGPVYLTLDRADEGEALLRRSLQIRRAAGLAQHRDMANGHAILGRMLLDRGKPAEAHAELQQSLSILEEQLGSDNANLGATLHSLAVAEHALGRHADAAEHAARAVELYSTHGFDHWVPTLRLVLARALWDGRIDRARARTEVEAARASYAARGDAEGLAKAEAVRARFGLG